MEYRKFDLSPGQQPPDVGSTGLCLPSSPSDSIIWIGDDGTWKRVDLTSAVMTKAEIDEYNNLISFNARVQPRGITFEEYCTQAKLDAAKVEIQNTLNTWSIPVAKAL